MVDDVTKNLARAMLDVLEKDMDNEASKRLTKILTANAKDDLIDLVRAYSPKPITHIVKVRGVEDFKIEDGKARHKDFPRVLQAVTCGPVNLVGPAGAGKTMMAEQIAEALKVDFYFTGAIQSEFKLLGFINAKGEVVRTPFREAYEKGGLFLFDEIDASSAQAILAFNAALANGSADFPDKCITRHKDFYVMAASNTFGTGATREYVGRNQLDAASLDRFIFLVIEYDEDLERGIAGNDSWVDVVLDVRKRIQEVGVKHIVSPRASLMGAKMLALNIPYDDVMNALVWKGLDKDTIAKIKARMTVKYRKPKSKEEIEAGLKDVDGTAVQPTPIKKKANGDDEPF